MKRTSPRSEFVCPVPGCGNPRLYNQAVCHTCWRRLPVDLSAPVSAAKKAKNVLAESRAAIAAVNWLHAHRPADQVAKILGEHGDSTQAPP